MNCFTDIAKTIPEFKTLVNAIHKNRVPVGTTGLSFIHKAHVVAALCSGFKRKGLVLVSDEAQASRMSADLNAFGINALVYPARDFSYRINETVSREYEHARLKVLDKMLTGDYDAVVLSAEAALQLTVPMNVLMANSISLGAGEDYEIDYIVELLIKNGYTKCTQIDGAGQFAVRGGILDFFPPDSSNPCRVEFFGDTIDSIFFFDLDTQRRTELLEEIRITPAKEVVITEEQLISVIEKHIKEKRIRGDGGKMLAEEIKKLQSGIKISSADKYLPLIYPKSKGIFDYAKGDMLFICDSFNVRDRFKAVTKLELETIKALFKEGELCRGLDRYILEEFEIDKLYMDMGAIYLDNLPRGSFDTPVKELINFSAKQLTPWNGSLSAITEDLKFKMSRQPYTCVVMAGTEKAAKTLALDLSAEGLSCTYYSTAPEKFPIGKVSVIPGGFSYGFEYTSSAFSVFTYRTQMRVKPKKARKSSKHAFSNLTELNRGEYVVHSVHGIGVFEGINGLETKGTIKDYLKIRYDKGDILYVPVTQLDQVAKYIGAASEDKTIKLNRLGGSDWQKTRTRVKASVKNMAKELIEIYSTRLKIEGHAFSPDIDMQNDFERRFEFEETQDQLRCVRDIKRDMEKPYPMDRLLCGDVGFGKTEVALRAVFKCIADGLQVAILVPTTILALQHYQTILKRFEGFPVEIAMLSRFCTKRDIDKTILNLQRGYVDVVVGTHRLISNDVSFKNLGLIVIDEEQRFGVAQKEKLKAQYPNVDVLTLTATPIPRTLNMAMTGIRDMSVIEEAPQDRQPVQTYVIEHDMGILIQAMQQELRRGGQVYYLYNRVETIERKAAEILAKIPDAHVRIAHGQMNEEELSDVWRALLDGEIDILVCTTIIETGVDVPNVNTLIIENADRMGLAQLHQIRGRVGRSPRRASAYFTFKRGKQLSEIAEKRLEAIREFTEFGAGFHIAMRDLEIRGAGNILGSNQHGQMESVGYDMYIKLLEQAISEERGEEIKESEKECLIDLPIPAHIPESYISAMPTRLQIYRRIADIRNEEDALDVTDELIDRFGDPPSTVSGLIKISLIRAKAVKVDIYEISIEGNRLVFKLSDCNMDTMFKLRHKYGERFTLHNKNDKIYFSVTVTSKDDKLQLIDEIIDTAVKEEK